MISHITLRFYDQIGLLRPASYGDNGYRYYGEEALLRLQQIRFYRELDLSLEQIKTVLDRPDFDLQHALEGHQHALQERVERLNCLIDTVDKTILHLRGKITMSKKDFYKGFDEEKQKQYEAQVRQHWGDEAMARTKNWNAYTPEEKNDILADLHEISAGAAANMEKGHDSPEAQYWIDRWYKAINTYFYECSLEVFEALGHAYTQEPDSPPATSRSAPGWRPSWRRRWRITARCMLRSKVGGYVRFGVLLPPANARLTPSGRQIDKPDSLIQVELRQDNTNASSSLSERQ